MKEKYWDGKWTRETHSTSYDASGCRIETVTEESSDYPARVASVTARDFLGRAVSVTTPLGITSNFYSGVSDRVVRVSRTGQPDTLYEYEAGSAGVPARTVLDVDGDGQVSYSGPDRINATVTRYEEDASNVWWRVTSSAESVGGVTNSASEIREQLTGLSPALLSRTVTVDAHNVTATVATAMDPETHVVTETSWSDTGAPATRRTLYGQLTEAAGLDGGAFLEYDGFGRAVSQTVTNGAGTVSTSAVVYDNLDNAVTNTTIYGDLTAVSATGHDDRGRAVSRTDALSNTVFTGYDSLGLALSLSGATYPVQYAYDTASRQTELDTTRDDLAWDKTCFLFDGATGLLTNKVYADNSSISFTYTFSGKPVRTTWARGAWKESLWDWLGQLTCTAYSDGTPAVTFTRNAFGTVTNASDATGLAHVYAVNDRQSVTNETVMSGASTNTLTRLLDGFNRPAGLRLDSGYSLFYGRDSESRISVISNAEFTAQYAYDNGYAAGHTLTLSNGNTLVRTLTRDPHRPWLVTSVTNLFNGAVVSSWAYAYDISGRVIQRNADSFGYNARSELTSALLCTNACGYVVDCIGNRLVSTGGGGETTYTANSLNQYTAVNAVARACDADGNLISFGAWGYGWDAENRLVSVTSNSVPVLSNSYDYRHRRGRKATPAAVRDMVYDGWNLIQETVTHTNGTSSLSHNYWGLDLSGTLQGAGGVGGLLAVKIGGQLYFPFYDNNGNIAEYVDALGNIRAHYEYSPFGETVAQTGDLADTFPHRFSTKYYGSSSKRGKIIRLF